MTADPKAFSLEAAAVTDRGLSEKRPENEDSMLSDPEHRIPPSKFCRRRSPTSIPRARTWKT